MKIKKAMVGVLLVLGIVLLLVACQSTPSQDEEYSYETKKGVVYSTVEGNELLLDIAWPTSGKGPYPALVYLYGGYWSMGSRVTMTMFIIEAAKRGFVAIAPDYRLVKLNQDGTYKNRFPAAVNDVMCAVRWLRANAEQYNIDPDKIGAQGLSAGAHLALMLGVTDSLEGWNGGGEYAGFSSRVQAVVSSAGPTDMKKCYETTRSKSAEKAVVNFLGGTPEQVPDVYEKASPITYVSSDDAPVLLLNGISDKLVPYEQAVMFGAEMQSVGASHIILICKGGHGCGESHFAAEFFMFFDEHLKGMD